MRGRLNNSGAVIDVNEANAELEFINGNITGNSAVWSGGVYINNGGTFIMRGGSITGNSTTNYGAGVRFDNGGGTFDMYGLPC